MFQEEMSKLCTGNQQEGLAAGEPWQVGLWGRNTLHYFPMILPVLIAEWQETLEAFLYLQQITQRLQAKKIKYSDLFYMRWKHYCPSSFLNNHKQCWQLETTGFQYTVICLHPQRYLAVFRSYLKQIYWQLGSSDFNKHTNYGTLSGLQVIPLI